jgi:hypothetical protein
MNIGMCVRMGSIVLMLSGLFLTGSGVIDLSGVTPARAGPVEDVQRQPFNGTIPIPLPGGTVPLWETIPQEERHTLQWDRRLPAATRFVVLAAFNNDAVRDNETGLVWEKSPQLGTQRWFDARSTCVNKNSGGRKGWRLPSVTELSSLVDPSVADPGPTLPPGHPFTNIQPASYWSATTEIEFPTGAWNVFFGNGFVISSHKLFNTNNVWCVRGGMNADVY